MTECPNLEMRDRLPDYVRGTLTGPSLIALERHLAECASCRAELAVVRNARAMLGVTPRIDTTRIAAAVVRSAAIRRDATAAIAHARRRRAWVSVPSRRLWLAAASLAAVVGAVALATRDNQPAGGAASVPPVVVQGGQQAAPESIATVRGAPVRSTTRPAPSNELGVGGGLTDLADAELESLLRELDGLEPQFEVEPATLLPVLEGDV